MGARNTPSVESSRCTESRKELLPLGLLWNLYRRYLPIV